MRDLFSLGSAHAWPEVLQFIKTCDCVSWPDGAVDALPARRRTVATRGCCPRIDYQQHLYSAVFFNLLRQRCFSTSCASGVLQHVLDHLASKIRKLSKKETTIPHYSTHRKTHSTQHATPNPQQLIHSA